jgi:hypothetical protein
MAQLMNRRSVREPNSGRFGDEIRDLLIGYSGPWKGITSRSSFLVSNKTNQPRFLFTFRYFSITDKDSPKAMTAAQEASLEGICLERENGVMLSLRGTENSAKFQEGRCSIQTIAATFTGFYGISTQEVTPSDWDQFPRFTSTILVDGPYPLRFDPAKTPLQVYGPSSGIAMFQYYIYTGINFWRGEWSRVLDAMEECLSVDVRPRPLPPLLLDFSLPPFVPR